MVSVFTSKDFQELQFLIFPYVFSVLAKPENQAKADFIHFYETHKLITKKELTVEDINHFANVINRINYELLRQESNTEREMLILKYSERFFDWVKEKKQIKVELLEGFNWDL